MDSLVSLGPVISRFLVRADFFAHSTFSVLREFIQAPLWVCTGVVKTTRTVAAPMAPVRFTDFASDEDRITARRRPDLGPLLLGLAERGREEESEDECAHECRGEREVVPTS